MHRKPAKDWGWKPQAPMSLEEQLTEALHKSLEAAKAWEECPACLGAGTLEYVKRLTPASLSFDHNRGACYRCKGTGYQKKK